MRKRRLISRAMFIGGTVAVLAGPAWSQEAPGERRQPDRNLTRPGEREYSGNATGHRRIVEGRYEKG